MKQFLGFLLFLSCFQRESTAQVFNVNGFIITRNGDTVRGNIIVNLDDLYVQAFRQFVFADRTGEERTYFPGDIEGYSIDADHAIRTSFPILDFTRVNFRSFKDVKVLGARKTSLFLLRKILGRASWYYYPHEAYNMKKRITWFSRDGYIFWIDHYIVLRENSQYANYLSSTNYTYEAIPKKQIARVLKDCPVEILNKYPRDLGFWEFEHFLDDYNASDTSVIEKK